VPTPAEPFSGSLLDKADPTHHGSIRVALNCAILQRGVSGTANTVRAIAQALTGEQGIELIEAAPVSERSPSRILNAGRAAIWDLWRAGRSAKHIDVLISPCNIGRAPRGVGHLLVVQDTMVLDYPHLFDPGYAAYARVLLGLSVRGATRVLTASHHACKCIRRRWPQARVTVIGWPAPAQVGGAPRALDAEPLTVLMVGATEPHKNHVGGIEAVRLARLLTGADLRLEIIGPPGRAEGVLQGLLRVVDPRGLWATRRGTVSWSGLTHAYGRAWALLQPSLHEGFGLPVLEAAGHGLPVIHTGASSLSEVCPAGDAGGSAPELLAAGLRRLLDPAAYKTASLASVEAATSRSPEAFASALRSVVEEVAG
jgi:glycosyltransferase involved in cell wall biosynthesis